MDHARPAGAWRALRPHPAVAALLGLMAVHVLLSFFWMRDNGFFSRPPLGDATYFRLVAYQLKQTLLEHGFFAWLKEAAAIPSDHPPLLPMVASLWSLLEPDDAVTPRALWWTTMTFWSLFALGARRLALHFGGPWFGTTVTAITLSCPIVIVYPRAFYHQLPMIALVLLTLDAVLRTECFTRRGRSLVAGALALFAVLMKMIAPLYFIGSFAAAAGIGLWRRGDRRRVIINVLLAAATASLAIPAWYLDHWGAVLNYTAVVIGPDGQATFSQSLPLLSVGRWTYYPRELINNGFGFPIALLVVAAGAALMSSRTAKSGRRPAASRAPAAVLAAGVLCGYPIIVMGQVSSNSQYVMHLIPLGALVLVAALRRIGNLRVRRAAGVLVTSACVWTAALA